jgi:hypothetical protein
MMLDKKIRNHSKLSAIYILIILIIIVTIVSSHNLAKHESRAESVAKAMADVIRKFYIANGIDFELIIYGKASPHINDVIDGVTKHLSNESITINIKQIDNIEIWNHEMTKSAVIFAKTAQQLISLHVMSHGDNLKNPKLNTPTHKSLKFLTHVEEIESSQQLNDVMAAFRKPPSLRLVNIQFFEFFLISNRDTVNLTANVFYSEEKCGIFHLKLLNVYDAQSQKWHAKLENFNHFENFHGCQVNFAVLVNNLIYSEEIREFVTRKNDYEKLKNAVSSNTFEFHGLMSELLKSMAARANFTTHITLIMAVEEGMTTYFGRNFEPSVNSYIMLTVSDLTSSLPYFHITELVDIYQYYYLTVPNGKYTNYEKLIMPFDELTWILLMTTFGFTFGIIFGVHRCPQWIRNIVFGTGEEINSC